jgi:hypothetical protein
MILVKDLTSARRAAISVSMVSRDIIPFLVS